MLSDVAKFEGITDSVKADPLRITASKISEVHSLIGRILETQAAYADNRPQCFPLKSPIELEL